MSPVRAESRQLLESPRRQLRSVCKTPYRVLDAPDLADDFYLNLVRLVKHECARCRIRLVRLPMDSAQRFGQQALRSWRITGPNQLGVMGPKGGDAGCGHDHRPTAHIRCDDADAPANLPTSAHPTHRRTGLERTRVELGLSRPHGASPRCAGSCTPAV
jgi:hypothetical protein